MTDSGSRRSFGWRSCTRRARARSSSRWNPSWMRYGSSATIARSLTPRCALAELAARNDGYHRVPLTDALIAAAAAEHGGLAVLHRDAHFDRLSETLAFHSVPLPGP